jgi:hypothetical protein
LLEPNLVPDARGSPGVYWNSPGISNDDNADDQLMILEIENKKISYHRSKKIQRQKKIDETARMGVVCCKYRLAKIYDEVAGKIYSFSCSELEMKEDSFAFRN